MNDRLQIITGDCRTALRGIPEKSVHCCVTSPPYWKQRDYGHADQIGREKNSEDYIKNLILCFEEVKRVIRDDGTLWVVIDDKIVKGQPACLPWRFVLAMQEDGWLFIKDIIWNKPNPTPQSVKKKPTHSHEYIFLFAKTFKYYYDREAIRTPYAASTVPRQMRAVSGHHKHANGAPGQTVHSMSKARPNIRDIYNGEATKDYDSAKAQNPSDTKRRILESLMKYDGANKKSVWTVPKGSYKGKHFATFPPALIKPCILAGCPVGGTVIDPFGGAGTTAEVAIKEDRSAILVELVEDSVKESQTRLAKNLCKTAESVVKSCLKATHG